MNDNKKPVISEEDRQKLMPLMKILKEKYPDEDIEKMLEEGDFKKIDDLLFTQ